MAKKINLATAAVVSGLTATFISIAANFIGGMEGKENTPYKDPVGVLTVCYGHTGNVEKRPYTDEECLALLEKDVAAHAKALDCIHTPMQPREQLAFISLAFNIGVAKFCGGSGYKTSTVVKKANAGDMPGACAAMSAWRNGCKNGKCTPLPGLVKRRAVERAVCEGKFDEAARIVKEWGLPGMTVDAIYDIAEVEEEQSVDSSCECECAEGAR